MRKHDAETANSPLKPWRPARLPESVETAYRDFCAAHLTVEPAGDRLALIGSYLYALATPSA